MSFQVEFDPSVAPEIPGGDAVKLLVWKDDMEGDTDLLCNVSISEQRDGVHIHVSDARGRPVAYLIDGLLAFPPGHGGGMTMIPVWALEQPERVLRYRLVPPHSEFGGRPAQIMCDLVSWTLGLEAKPEKQVVLRIVNRAAHRAGIMLFNVPRYTPLNQCLDMICKAADLSYKCYFQGGTFVFEVAPGYISGLEGADIREKIACFDAKIVMVGSMAEA